MTIITPCPRCKTLMSNGRCPACFELDEKARRLFLGLSAELEENKKVKHAFDAGAFQKMSEEYKQGQNEAAASGLLLTKEGDQYIVWLNDCDMVHGSLDDCRTFVSGWRNVVDCPNIKNHTPMPSGYMAQVAWAQNMRETHIQQQCPDCGRWAIWEERKDTTESLTRDAQAVGLTFEPIDSNGRYGIVRFDACDMVVGTLAKCRDFIDEWRMAEI